MERLSNLTNAWRHIEQVIEDSDKDVDLDTLLRNAQRDSTFDIPDKTVGFNHTIALFAD